MSIPRTNPRLVCSQGLHLLKTQIPFTCHQTTTLHKWFSFLHKFTQCGNTKNTQKLLDHCMIVHHFVCLKEPRFAGGFNHPASSCHKDCMMTRVLGCQLVLFTTNANELNCHGTILYLLWKYFTVILHRQSKPKTLHDLNKARGRQWMQIATSTLWEHMHPCSLYPAAMSLLEGLGFQNTFIATLTTACVRVALSNSSPSLSFSKVHWFFWACPKVENSLGDCY